MAQPPPEPRRRRRTPQEKKALSLAKDRRNIYGANPEASRKGIAKGKARARRTNRRATSALLARGIGASRDGQEAAQDAVTGRRPRQFVKLADEALGTRLARRRGNELPQ